MLKKQSIIILMYHSIDTVIRGGDKRYTCAPKLFEKQMQYLVNQGYCFIPLSEMDSFFNDGKTVPEKSVIITFDDGFEDNYYYAFPILKKFTIPATIFIVSDLLDKTNQWMINEGLDEKKMLSWEKIKEMMQSGIEFGGHSLNHQRLVTLEDDELNNQIVKNKKDMEDSLGCSLISFAYPYGLYNESVLNAVSQAGYKIACSTRSGFNNNNTSPFLLRRLEIKGTDSLFNFKQKITFGTNDSSLFFPMKYYWQRLQTKIGLSL
jgi:peptidoglycan/xylan/chitin deacetylase (PgdA/CDA1 family)